MKIDVTKNSININDEEFVKKVKPTGLFIGLFQGCFLPMFIVVMSLIGFGKACYKSRRQNKVEAVSVVQQQKLKEVIISKIKKMYPEYYEDQDWRSFEKVPSGYLVLHVFRAKAKDTENLAFDGAFLVNLEMNKVLVVSDSYLKLQDKYYPGIW